MSNYYANYSEYLNSQKCCNIKSEFSHGLQGPTGLSVTGPTGITGPMGISITGPTGPSKKGPTGPTGPIDGEILGTTGPYYAYLLSEKYVEVPEYLKVFKNNKFYWIPIITQNPVFKINSPSWFFSENLVDFSYNLSTGEILLKWNQVENANNYKIFNYDIFNNSKNGIIDLYLQGPVDKYGQNNNFIEIYNGSNTYAEIILEIDKKYNLYLYAYDNLGNRSPTPITQLYIINYVSQIYYEIWSTTIFTFQNNINNYTEWINSSSGTTTLYLPYFDISYGPYTYQYIINDPILAATFPNQSPINYINSILLS